jgi:hypothetical protein
MVLEAPDGAVRDKWLSALARDAAAVAPAGFASECAPLLLTEGYLTKVQPMIGANTVRWFRLTATKLSYAVGEAGPELASTPYDVVTRVRVGPGARDFVVTSVQPFTASGSYEVHCRCASPAIRTKWVTALARVIPAAKFVLGP